MSTRAIIQITDTLNPVYGSWSLYAHSDGYPEFMKKLIEKVIELSKTSIIPNVATGADKFTVYLINEFHKAGYNSLYMTMMDPEKAAKSSEGTDIEYLYKVNVNENKSFTLRAFKLDGNRYVELKPKAVKSVNPVTLRNGSLYKLKGHGNKLYRLKKVVDGKFVELAHHDEIEYGVVKDLRIASKEEVENYLNN